MADYLGSVALPSMKQRQKKLCQVKMKTRAEPVYSDSSNFGVRMLEKLGWSEGKGLGKREDGMSAPILPKLKQDSEGFGYAGEKDNHWTQHDQDFNQLLKSLNGEEAPPVDEVDRVRMKSLEEKSKNSRARVHYKKFTRGKDLSRASEKDLANIFGKRTMEEVKQQQVGGGEMVGQLEEEQPEETEEGEERNILGLTTIKAGVSVQDYFKQKMQEKLDALKKGSVEEVKEVDEFPSAKKSKKSKKNKEAEEEPAEDVAPEVELIDDEVPKKKEKKKRSNEEVPEVVENDIEELEEPPKKKSKKEKRNASSDEPEMNSQVVEEQSEEVTEEPVKKKSKKKKKKASNEEQEVVPEVTAAETEEILPETPSEEVSIKKKKKKKSKTEEPAPQGESTEQNGDVDEELTCRVKVGVLKQLDEHGFAGSNFADIVGYGLTQDVRLIKREGGKSKRTMEKLRFVQQKQTTVHRKRQMLKKVSAFKAI